MRHSVSKLSLEHEFQREAVHTVSFTSRRRAVIENMAEVVATPGAEHFRPHHSKTNVRLLNNIQWRDWY
jgi:hypothetical protein